MSPAQPGSRRLAVRECVLKPRAGVYRVSRVAAMRRLAGRLAARLAPGSVVALHGEMGAGKTTFAQALASALGVRQPVTSPTFALAAEYPLPDGGLFVHLDLFRLRAATDLAAIGFQEYLEQGAMIALEWPERAGDLLPDHVVHVRIRLEDGSPGVRLVTVEPAI